MKKKRNYKLYLKDILDAIKNIREYTHGLTFQRFVDEKMIVDAVVRNFEIIGEAAKNIPENTRFMYREIPWKEMSGMRNKIIHEYFGIDLDIIWKTIQGLSDLEKVLKKIYRGKDKEKEGKN